jgi:rod shape-determining protein MreC
MESFFVRYRNYIVLLAMLMVQIIGLAVQVRRTAPARASLGAHDGSGVRLIRLWADALVSPPERAVHATKLAIVSVWENYFYLRRTKAENEQLQQTIDRLRLEQAALLEDAKQGQRLQALLGFQQKYLYSTRAAQVFGSSGTDLSHVFYIDKGASDHLERDMAVITPDGIVGKVREVFGHSAQVLAINDQTSGAGVILETTRIRGTLRGNANGELQIINLLADNRIKPGEIVLTGGGDQIFPRGLPVGAVERVVPDPEKDGFIKVMIKPSAHLEQLDEVLVITSMQPRFSPQQDKDVATSEQLKGAEAAALEEQRKASTIMAERLPGLTDPNAPPKPPPAPDAPKPSLLVVPPAKALKAEHPDRFSPGAAPGAGTDSGAAARPKPKTEALSGGDSPQPNAAADQAGQPAKPVKPAAKPKTPPASTPSGPPASTPATPPASTPAAPPAVPDAKPERNP